MAISVRNPEVIEVASRQEKDTELMTAVAKAIGVTEMADFPGALAKLLNQKGFSLVVGELGVSKATLGYWLRKLGVEMTRVAFLRDQQRVLIVPKNARVTIEKG